MSIPSVDLADFLSGDPVRKNDFVQKLGKAYEEVGFVAVKNHGVPVVMDCTHSLQQPNQSSGVTGGNPQMIETIAKAAIATGADGLFIETHPDPSCALSDGANMLKLDLLEDLLIKLMAIRKAVI